MTSYTTEAYCETEVVSTERGSTVVIVTLYMSEAYCETEVLST